MDDAADRCSERVATGHHKGKGHEKEKRHGKKGHGRHGVHHLTLRDCLLQAV